MERRQILQKLFGDHSEEEEAYLNDGLNHQANPAFDGGLEHENEGKAENKGKSAVHGRGAPKGVCHNHIRSSRSLDIENNVVPDEDATYEGKEECTKTKVKGKKVASSDVYEIPLRQPPVAPDQVESRARFVMWSDGNLQLLIGNEAFDVSEQDARDIQSHIFVEHEKD